MHKKERKKNAPVPTAIIYDSFQTVLATTPTLIDMSRSK